MIPMCSKKGSLDLHFVAPQMLYNTVNVCGGRIESKKKGIDEGLKMQVVPGSMSSTLSPQQVTYSNKILLLL